MKGFVVTPPQVVDLMVDKLFSRHHPMATETLLDPGCGTGAFIEGVIRWCKLHQAPIPAIQGIDINPDNVSTSRTRFAGLKRIIISLADFLTAKLPQFDYIIGNPPYVPITGLSESERTTYRRQFLTATGRFDLYLLFFEKALKLLRPQGRMTLITPEKFLYVNTAAPLRRLLSARQIEEMHFLHEDTFPNLVTYPLVTTITEEPPAVPTRLLERSGLVRSVELGDHGSSWLPAVRGARRIAEGPTLADATLRVSCGVATGADSIYLQRIGEIPAALKRFSRPTLSGRQILPGRPLTVTHSLLIPYNSAGVLIPEARLGPLGRFLGSPARKTRLAKRTCAARKPWYAFHETPPLGVLLRPKILCKDIGASPFFVVDRGGIVPRHSVYYVVPKNPSQIDDLADYLNSQTAQEWLHDHCQRAAKGFIRLQSHVLRRLPIPERFVEALQEDAFSPAAV